MGRTLVIFTERVRTTIWGTQHYLVIESAEFYKRIGRFTFLAEAILKYVVKKKIRGRRTKRYLNEKEMKLLKGCLEYGTKGYALFRRALREEWTEDELITNLCFKLL